MIRFKGSRESTGKLSVVVEVEDAAGRTRIDPLSPRHDLFNHSPDGFECGYSGSGPAQLAVAILARYFHKRVDDARIMAHHYGLDLGGVGLTLGERVAIRLHQSFKFAKITPLPRDAAWEIDEGDVDAWLREQRASKAEAGSVT